MFYVTVAFITESCKINAFFFRFKGNYSNITENFILKSITFANSGFLYQLFCLIWDLVY